MGKVKEDVTPGTTSNIKTLNHKINILILKNHANFRENSNWKDHHP